MLIVIYWSICVILKSGLPSIHPTLPGAPIVVEAIAQFPCPKVSFIMATCYKLITLSVCIGKNKTKILKKNSTPAAV